MTDKGADDNLMEQILTVMGAVWVKPGCVLFELTDDRTNELGRAVGCAVAIFMANVGDAEFEDWIKTLRRARRKAQMGLTQLPDEGHA